MEIFIEKPVAQLCSKDEAMLWNRRLGHIGQCGLDTLEKVNMIPKLNKLEKVGFCDVCVEAKHARDPRTRATRILERIHSDACGPIEPVAADG